MGGALFMPHKDMLDDSFFKGVVDRQDRSPRVTKHNFHVFLLQAPDKGFRNSNFQS
jgi:hypothetical protein